MKYRHLGAFVLFFSAALLTVTVRTCPAEEPMSAPATARQTITLDLTRMPLKDAAAEIARQTGYAVAVEKQWGDIPVSGRFNGIEIETFFRRVLKKNNLSIVTDEQKKTITVRLFGSKEQADLLTAVPVSNMDSDGEQLSKYSSITRKVYQKLVSELAAWKNDPDSIDPMTGNNLARVRETYNEQVEELVRQQDDPTVIDPLSGKQLVRVRQDFEDQVNEMERLESSPETIDPFTGKSVAEIKNRYQEQVAALERWKRDPDAIDPMTGNKLSAVRRRYEEQIKKLTAESSL